MMRPVPAKDSWWAWSLYTGICFAGMQALIGGWRDPDNWPSWVISGVVYGVIVGPAIARGRRRLDAAVGPMSGKELRRVRRAAMFGPPPGDPELRQAAARLAVHELDEVIRYRLPQVIVLGLVVLTMIVAAVAAPRFFVVAASFAALLVAVQVLRPWRLRRRIALLRGEADL
jgi:hypothetical protein